MFYTKWSEQWAPGFGIISSTPWLYYTISKPKTSRIIIFNQVKNTFSVHLVSMELNNITLKHKGIGVYLYLLLITWTYFKRNIIVFSMTSRHVLFNHLMYWNYAFIMIVHDIHSIYHKKVSWKTVCNILFKVQTGFTPTSLCLLTWRKVLTRQFL